jgi:hypothetical protein
MLWPRDGVRLSLILVGALIFLPSQVSGVEIAPERYSIGEKAPQAFVPFAASHSLSEPNRRITRVLFSIHSSGFDAVAYYDHARTAAAKAPGALAETLIVAPQFFEKPAIPGTIPDGLLYWRVSPFRGSSRGAIGVDEKPVEISAFDVLDRWLSSLTDPNLFPQLRDIVLFGHSAGGQFVQRYAMVGKFEPPTRIKLRYVVSAPSSYAYPSGERYNSRAKKFVVPDANTLSACPDYNKWGYGLDAPYAYFSDTRRDAIAERYAARAVFYLCGANDNDPNDDAIGKSCGAMLQGRHRLERMQVFAEYLRQEYGPKVKQRHHFAVVPKIGHFGRGTMTSASGLKFLFAPIE